MAPRRDLTRHQKDVILERDAYVCFYCLDEAIEVDHIMPVSYYPNNDPENLIAACEPCNRIAGNKVFLSLGEKFVYIRAERKKYDRRKGRRSSKGWMIAICPWCGQRFPPRRDGATGLICGPCMKKDGQ